MFRRIFGGSNNAAPSSSAPSTVSRKTTSSTVDTIDKLNETLSMLEKREALIQKKIEAELEKAKEYTRANNKRAALQCLKKKKMYEQQLDTLSNQQLRLADQINVLEGAKITAETVLAMKSAAGAMKNIAKETNIGDVDRTMEEINEQTENLRQVQDALAEPVGTAADLDEDELAAELAELEQLELDQELLEQPMPSAPKRVPQAQQKQPAAAMTSEEEELEALQAEMQLLGA